MRMKDGVDTTNVSPALWLMLGMIASWHRVRWGSELTVTSLRRPPDGGHSKHSPPAAVPCMAADIRRRGVGEPDEWAVFARDLQHRFGPDLGVVLEPEWLTLAEVTARGGLDQISPHLHVELKNAGWPTSL